MIIAADRVLRTSGHSGEPVDWERSGTQLVAEAELIGTAVLGPVDQVVTFAPTTHLYGMLFGDLLPRILGVPVQDLSHDVLALPDVPPGRRTLFVCLPASWHVMRAVAAGDGDLTGSIALHGTGPTTAVTAQVLPALTSRGLRAVELFGSTETGGVAHRDISAHPEPWRLLPDVTFVDRPEPVGETCLLHVRSPRIARRADAAAAADTHCLSDVVRIVGDREFHFVGRRSRLVKINGRRCDLGAVEELLAAALPGADVVCLAVRDGIRGEHYELFHTGPAEDVRPRLRVLLGDLPMPRGVHRVPSIPRTATGKVKTDRLYSLGVSAR